MVDIVRLPTSGGAANTTKPWQPPSWLEEWRATDMPPARAAEIEASLARLDEALAPAGADAISVLLIPLSDLFGPPRAEAAPLYLDLLAELPAQAIEAAVTRCMRELKFYPMPAEILERAEEFHRLINARTRMRTALWRIGLEERGRFSRRSAMSMGAALALGGAVSAWAARRRA